MLTIEQKIEILEKLRKFIESEDFCGLTDGICIAIRNPIFTDRLKFFFNYKDYLEWFSEILYEERIKSLNKEFLNTFPYYWPKGEREPRIKWVDKQLEILRCQQN